MGRGGVTLLVAGVSVESGVHEVGVGCGTFGAVASADSAFGLGRGRKNAGDDQIEGIELEGDDEV